MRLLHPPGALASSPYHTLSDLTGLACREQGKGGHKRVGGGPCSAAEARLPKPSRASACDGAAESRRWAAREPSEQPGSGAGGQALRPACGSCRSSLLATSAHLHGAAHGGHAALRGGAGREGGEGEPGAGLVALPGLQAGSSTRCQLLPEWSERPCAGLPPPQALTVAPEAATPVRAATVCMVAMG